MERQRRLRVTDVVVVVVVDVVIWRQTILCESRIKAQKANNASRGFFSRTGFLENGFFSGTELLTQVTDYFNPGLRKYLKGF